MSGVVAWGIGMMIGSKVADKQDWFSEDFRNAMKIGGAALTIYGAGAAAFGSEAAAAEGALGGASAMGEQGSMLAAQTAEFGAEGAAMTDAAGSLTGSAIGETQAGMLATQNAGMGAEGIGMTYDASATASGLEPAAGAVTGGGSAMVDPLDSQLDAAIAEEEALSLTPDVPSVDVAANEVGKKGMLETTDPGADSSWWDSKYTMPSAVIGGQALSGYAQSRSLEKIAEREEAERQAEYDRKTRWGTRNDGSGGIDLNLGDRLATVNDRYFSSLNSTSDTGLLSS